MTNATIWLHSIVAAFVGGGANAISGVIAAGIILPNQINTGAGLNTALKLMGVTFVIGGVISVVMFLKQSPVPEGWDGVNRRAT